MKKLLLSAIILMVCFSGITQGEEDERRPAVFCYSGSFPLFSYTTWVTYWTGYYHGQVNFVPFDDDDMFTTCYQAVGSVMGN